MKGEVYAKEITIFTNEVYLLSLFDFWTADDHFPQDLSLFIRHNTIYLILFAKAIFFPSKWSANEALLGLRILYFKAVLQFIILIPIHTTFPVCLHKKIHLLFVQKVKSKHIQKVNSLVDSTQTLLFDLKKKLST